MITHHAIELYEVLQDLAVEDQSLAVPIEYQAVLLKALIVHGGTWPDEAELFEQIIPPSDPKKWLQRRSNIARLMGFGRPDINKVKVRCF